MGALVYVYIMGEVVHAHAHNAQIDSSKTGLGVVSKLLSKSCWLRIQ